MIDTELTPEGREYAEEREQNSITANVALYGHETGWPGPFINASRKVMNEDALAEIEAWARRVESETLAAMLGTGLPDTNARVAAARAEWDRRFPREVSHAG